MTLPLLLLLVPVFPEPVLAGAGRGGAVLESDDRVDLRAPGLRAETLAPALGEAAAFFFAGFFAAFFAGFFTDFFEAFFAGFFTDFFADFLAGFFADFFAVLAISESLV